VSQEKILIQGDPDLEELIPGFLRNRKKDIGLINQALTENDFKTIRIIGHSMKGAGGGYGFAGITEIGSNLETAAIENDLARIEESRNLLEDYLQRVEVVFD